MFQFPGFALVTLCIQVTSPWLTPLLIPEGDNNRVSGGFPHSEIFGSKPIPGSPKLIAGYRVLHRLLLPRHPPNALIALDLTRKKKDPASLRASGYPRQVPQRLLRSKACIYSRLPVREDLVSVLDLDNAAVFPQSEDRAIRTPTRVRPTTLIISLNDVNAIQDRCVRLDGTAQTAVRSSRRIWWSLPAGAAGKRKTRLDQPDRAKRGMVEPDGVEPTTSCLQSRRSTN